MPINATFTLSVLAAVHSLDDMAFAMLLPLSSPKAAAVRPRLLMKSLRCIIVWFVYVSVYDLLFFLRLNKRCTTSLTIAVVA